MTDQPDNKPDNLTVIIQEEKPTKKPNITAGMIDEIQGKDGPKAYTGMEATVTWFRKDYPNSRIHTDYRLENGLFVFETVVYINDVEVSNAHAFYAGQVNGDALKKAETASVRRALSFLGYNGRAALMELGRELVKNGAANRLGNGTGNRIGGNPQQRNSQPAGDSVTDKAFGMVKELVNHRNHFDNILIGLRRVNAISDQSTAEQIAAAVVAHVNANKEKQQQKSADAPAPAKGASWLKGKEALPKFLERSYKILGAEEGLPFVLDALNIALRDQKIESVLDFPGSTSDAYGAVIAYAVNYEFSQVTESWLRDKGFANGITDETRARAKYYCEQRKTDAAFDQF